MRKEEDGKANEGWVVNWQDCVDRDAFPYNLLLDTLKTKEEYIADVSLRSLLSALLYLKDRERQALILRYGKKLTLRECGEIMEVTASRVRQIIELALRKLRHPSRVRTMLTSTRMCVEQMGKTVAILSHNNDLLTSVLRQIAPEKAAEKAADTIDVPLAGMGLSVRPYNCLARRGKKTARDVASMTETDLRMIRGMGERSIREVKAALAAFGLSLRKEG